MSLEQDLARALAFKAFAETATGPEIVERALCLCLMSQADLSRSSGITQETLRRFKNGSRPTQAHITAMSWAVMRRFK
jgi:hypothetical protein